MNAPAVNWVLEQTFAGSSLYGWCQQLKGKMYENSLAVPPVPNPGAVIASTLDAMVMIAGAYQSSPTGSIPPIDDPTQGCLAPKTQIPGPVILIFILVTLSTVVVLFYWLYLATALHILAARKDGSITERPPNGLMDWMRQAVQETGLVRKATHADLKDWLLVAVPHEQRLRLVRREDTLDEDLNKVRMIDYSVHAKLRHGYMPPTDGPIYGDMAQDPKYSNTMTEQIDTGVMTQLNYVKRKPLGTAS
jgi:hypothetical protein